VADSFSRRLAAHLMAAVPFAPGQHAFAGSSPPLPEGEVAWLWEVDTGEDLKEAASAFRVVPAALAAEVQSLQRGLSGALEELGCLRDEVETLRGELAAVRATCGPVDGRPSTEAVQEKDATRRPSSNLSVELRDLVASECRAGAKVLAGAVQWRISELEALTKALCSVSPPLPSAPSLGLLGKEEASALRPVSQTADTCEGPSAVAEGSSSMGLSPKARVAGSRYDTSESIQTPRGSPMSSPPLRPNSESAFFRRGGSPRLSVGANLAVASGVLESGAAAATSMAQRPQSSLEAPALRARKGLPPSARWPPPRWEQAPLSSRGWHW